MFCVTAAVNGLHSGSTLSVLNAQEDSLYGAEN